MKPPPEGLQRPLLQGHWHHKAKAEETVASKGGLLGEIMWNQLTFSWKHGAERTLILSNWRTHSFVSNMAQVTSLLLSRGMFQNIRGILPAMTRRCPFSLMEVRQSLMFQSKQDYEGGIYFSCPFPLELDTSEFQRPFHRLQSMCLSKAAAS